MYIESGRMNDDRNRMAEQPLNAKMVVEDIKIELRVETCDGSVKGFVKWEGLNKMIKELMEGEKGKRYNLDLCKNVIGEAVYPVVKATNLYYEGADIAGIYTLPIYSLFQSKVGKTLQ
ncbi:hypothetical protein Tco_1417083, partial [Tanacetum coccineum]